MDKKGIPANTKPIVFSERYCDTNSFGLNDQLSHNICIFAFGNNLKNKSKLIPKCQGIQVKLSKSVSPITSLKKIFKESDIITILIIRRGYDYQTLNLLPPQLDQLIQLWETTGTTQMKMCFMNGHLMAQVTTGLIYLQAW